MINRFLSMKPEWVVIVNEFQKYTLDPKILYKLYIDVIPKRKQYIKYIKEKDNMKYPQWVLEAISKHYEVSIKQSYEYVEVFLMTEGGKVELHDLLAKYGVDPKELKKLNLR